MDYRCRVLIAFLVGLYSLSVQAKPGLTELPVAASWLHPNTPLEVITSSYLECLNPAAPAAAVLGRLAFESPALLGGQSARMGLSCSACHLSARGNAHFYLEGISGVAGTADVSQSFLSTAGGNDNFSPKPIPDLAVSAQRVIKDRSSELFREKLKQLIEVEFDGQEALPEVFEAVLTYLANIDQQYCTSLTATEAKFWASDWQRLSETIVLLQQAFEVEDNTLADFLIRVARYRLENIYRASSLADNKRLNTKLVESSRALVLLKAQRSKQEKLNGLLQWQRKSQLLIPLLQKTSAKSAYNAKALQEMSKSL